MVTQRAVADRVRSLVGSDVVSTSPVAGGDICVATRVRLVDGRSLFVKTRAKPPEGFFATEARGLRWLAAANAVSVPEVVAQDTDCLVLQWVEPARPSREAAERLGRGLGELHRSGADGFGGDSDGYIGPLPLANRASASWPKFWVEQRVLPYLRAARDRRSIGPDEVRAVEQVVDRIEALAGPAEPPARLHGDLWSGNLLWSAGDTAYVVDPAAHGGHRETDLAMLALFGAPYLDRVLAAYQDAFPLADGWRERVPLHQLHPLLVHAVLFGGGYGARVGRAARSALAS